MKDQYQPPPGPPPGYRHEGRPLQSQQQHTGWHSSGQGNDELASNNPFRRSHINTPTGPAHSRQEEALPEYQAPRGPPPSWRGDKKSSYEEYAPPPGPPPAHTKHDDAEPPPYDPWLAVPDNALLPPPPSMFEELSPTANATYDDAARGHAWCRQNPLWQPRPQNQDTLSRIAAGKLHLTTPPNANKNISLFNPSPGKTHVRTSPSCPDSILLSDLPIYTATTAQPQTLYFELHVLRMGGDSSATEEADAGIALGFVAPPYPSWRLPGWHRASLGVHGDDGRRYIDNSFGGKDFVSMFKPGETVGIGMAFSLPTYAGGKKGCQVFFTRNGRREGGWDLYEEKDGEQEEGDVTGLEGRHDLLAAVGCFGGVEFEARFRREEWMFRP